MASSLRRLGLGRVETTDRNKVTLLSFGVGFLLSLVHGTAPAFLYDASKYWDAANALISGADAYVAGGLDIRGVLSAVIYVPAALVSQLVGAEAAAVAVLIQNALVIAAVGSVIVPGIVRLMVPARQSYIVLSAVMTSLLLAGFAPYTLLDQWALAFLLAGVLLVFSKNPIALIVGGLSLGVAINLRPAMLVPVALGAILWTTFNWRRAVLPAAGFGAAFVPQMVVNKLVRGEIRPWPLDTFLVTNIQAHYASFTVRYDTVAFDDSRDPRQFYCSPDLAAAVVVDPPTDSVGLATAFLREFPSSLLFLSEKVASSLQWSWATPYSDSPGAFSWLALIVVPVSVVGLLALIYRALSKESRIPALTLLAIWFGSVATIVFSAAEARFAIVIVMIGAIGCLTISPVSRRNRVFSRRVYVWVGVGVALITGLFFFAATGLANAAAPGDVTISECVK